MFTLLLLNLFLVSYCKRWAIHLQLLFLPVLGVRASKALLSSTCTGPKRSCRRFGFPSSFRSIFLSPFDFFSELWVVWVCCLIPKYLYIPLLMNLNLTPCSQGACFCGLHLFKKLVLGFKAQCTVCLSSNVCSKEMLILQLLDRVIYTSCDIMFSDSGIFMCTLYIWLPNFIIERRIIEMLTRCFCLCWHHKQHSNKHFGALIHGSRRQGNNDTFHLPDCDQGLAKLWVRHYPKLLPKWSPCSFNKLQTTGWAPCVGDEAHVHRGGYGDVPNRVQRKQDLGEETT